MITRFKLYAINILLLLLSFNTYAFNLKTEFSAEAVQVSPGRPPLVSTMYVSKNAVRTEMVQQGNRVIDIFYVKEGKRLLLYPDKKLYLEQNNLPIPNSISNTSKKTPCEGGVDVKCKKLGKETLDKIKVEKWQIEKNINGKIFKSLHWIDSKRNLSVKDMFPDGGLSQLMMMGKEKLNGRNVERWESRYTHPSGQNRVSRQWYDPQLKMVIKEELPGGYLRELKNIKVTKQEKTLFKLPKDFKKLRVNAAGFETPMSNKRVGH